MRSFMVFKQACVNCSYWRGNIRLLHRTDLACRSLDELAGSRGYVAADRAQNDGCPLTESTRGAPFAFQVGIFPRGFSTLRIRKRFIFRTRLRVLRVLRLLRRIRQKLPYLPASFRRNLEPRLDLRKYGMQFEIKSSFPIRPYDEQPAGANITGLRSSFNGIHKIPITKSRLCTIHQLPWLIGAFC
ncbi:hypothetical protein D3C86_871420 [compost metagenome]